mmetsp:Transcript_10493/g.25385  ORF Transcript_10493/g.25385 Transcript_10493/m.25385 type:complete len:481 (+) Transcript_10493:33-1475(+)
MSGAGACPKSLVEAYGKDPSHVATSMDKPAERRKGTKKSKQRVSDEEHLISMLERLSLELSTSRGTHIGRCPFCNCCKKYVARQRSKSKEKVGSKGRSKSCGGLVDRERAELPVDHRPKMRDPEPLPSKVPKPGKEKRSGADGQKPQGRPRLRRRGLGGLEDKTPSPRPPRARSAGRAPMINTAPQLSVEARSRRRATSASRLSAQRAPVRASSESRLRGPSAAEGLADSVRGSKGRRAPRNLLAELYRPNQETDEMQRRRGVIAQQEPFTLPDSAARAPRFGYQEAAQFWEPVTAEPTTQGAARFNGGFAPPPRIHVPTLQTAGNRSPARVHQDLDTHLQPERRSFDGASPGEIIYGPRESPGQLDPNCRGCGSSYTEDSIFCRHCGSKRAQTRTGHLEASSPKADDLDLDNATRQLEQLVEETHRALRAGTHNQDASLSEGSQAAPSLDAVDRALEELQRGLLEIDTVLAKPIPEASP